MKIVDHSRDSFRILAVLFCVPLAAQDANGLQPRQLYYKARSSTEVAAPKSTTAAEHKHRLKTTTAGKAKPENKGTAEPSPLGLKYIVEQENSSGKDVQVDPDKTFSTNDAIRLRVEVNRDAYVYLLSRGASGDGSFLFPQPGEDNRLKAFRSVQVPAKPDDPILFGPPAGTEMLYILVSLSPVADLDRYLPARGSSRRLMASNVPGSEFGEIVDRAERLQGRDLVRGKVRPESGAAPGGTNELAVYALNVGLTSGGQILEKLELKHRGPASKP